MISERMLRKWRREALSKKRYSDSINGIVSIEHEYLIEVQHRVLLLTQELLDQHLMKKEK